MGMPEPAIRFTPATFLAWELEQPERHEFVDGEVYAMTGARDAHNRVAINIVVALRNALRGTPCRTFMSDMKLHVASAGAYFYPDVIVACDTRDHGAEADLVKQHAVLLVEVLSKSTAAYDRGRKFEVYSEVASLREVLFVEPNRRHVDLFRRASADDRWVLHPANGDDILTLASIGSELPLDAVYEDVLPLGSELDEVDDADDGNGGAIA